ncbi:MAG: threonyl-tRNA synthetase [Parcubacteria group bacterium Licking1014_17]|nr:MAG: threonyl-tRNA synthetase [Parcubacteria group bacterium Licking1014_17]
MNMDKEEQLHNLRHSLAHLLAAAVSDLYPKTKLTIGPVIENGFYYDFDFAEPISDEDLPKIEKKMKEIMKGWNGFERIEMDEKEAKKFYKDNPYKYELVEELAGKGEQITFYKVGEFSDLCRGGHVEDVGKIDPHAFKLTHIAGAYWRGDEKNKMLTRIYGAAFETKKELDDYLKMLEEAEKRDHRKLGKELELFTFSEIVGKGLPLWLPKGATIRRVLERFIVDEELKRGYQHVYTPDIAKLDLYKKSGHYPYYKDSMYAPIKIDDEEFMLRPMTCPHHFELYLSRPRSYRELPMRIAELAKQYRYEQSGELSGLIRVRGFCLADAHIICKDKDQAMDEVSGVLDLIEFVAEKFGLKMGEDFRYRLSLGDRKDEKKYYKDDKSWDEGEEALRELLKKRGSEFTEAPNEAAFYGPKIDIQMRNVRGKEDTAFTVQYDFVMPKRFNLIYTDADGQEKQTIVVHRSSIGAIERIIAFLIEHFAGALPLWLSPIQVAVLTISEKQIAYAEKVVEELKKNGIRVELSKENETIGKKIREAEMQKIPYLAIIGDKEVDTNKIAVRERGKGDVGQMKTEEFIEKILEEINRKSL